jgi:outer membrane protein assembly factor BamB
VLVVGAAIACALPVRAQEAGVSWPQFQGGPGHPGALADGPEPPYRVRWTVPAPEGAALSGAVIVGDEAIALGERAVYGIDLATGERRWQVPRDGGPLSVPAAVAPKGGGSAQLLYLEGPATASGEASPSVSPSGTPSPTASSPSISPSGSETGEATGSELVAIEVGDQTERWRAPLGATSRTGVAVAGDTAFVGDDDGVVTAVAIADGSVRWRKPLRETDGACTGLPAGRVDVPLAVADGNVVAVVRDLDSARMAVVALDAETGGCRWEQAPQVGSATASAAAAGDGSVVVGIADRTVRSFAGSDGAPSWDSLALTVFSPASSPALVDGSVYVADLGGGVYRLDAGTGERIWSYQLNELTVRSSPVVSGGAVLVGLNDGRLVALDRDSGHLIWQSAATQGLIGSIAISPDVIVAVKGGRDAGLIAFERDPDGTLVDVPSPTELDLGTLLVRAGSAAVVVLIVVLVPGTLARRRFGDAFASEGPAEEELDDELDGGADE